MRNYIAVTITVLVLYGCTVNPNATVPNNINAKDAVILGCKKLEQLKTYRFDMPIHVGLGSNLYGGNAHAYTNCKANGVWKGPDFCYFKCKEIPQFEEAGNEFELYRQNNKIALKDGGKQWDKGLKGIDDKDEKNSIIEHVFTPFYRTADLGEFLKNAKFRDNESVNGVECRVVKAVVSQDNFKDVLNMDDVFDIVGRETVSETPGKEIEVKLIAATYKFWLGKDDCQIYKIQRILMHKSTFPSKEGTPTKWSRTMEINMTIYDHDKDVDLQIPLEVKDILGLSDVSGTNH
ncbi:MAG: hypothetical protein HZA49_07285 [Planctomycetes bacterium]|nr:hypothetical protein [Planctomycetota bacterium]